MFRNLNGIKLKTSGFTTICRHTHITTKPFTANATHSCKLLVVGGGTGGCATAAKFARKFNDPKQIIILEPSETHYYQPLFTLIGGGVKKLKDAERKMSDVLPSKATWIQDEVMAFYPNDDMVTTMRGDKIKYEFLLIAVGLQTHYEQIPGLVEALNLPEGVCSNYDKKYVTKTFTEIQNFKGGNAIFTYPDSPVKCPGAPQKICYIAEHYWRMAGKREIANVIYNTSLPVIFGVKKYADSLWRIVDKRNIEVNLRTNLIAINPDKREALFSNLENPVEQTTFEYTFMHVTPPMTTPDCLKSCTELVNEAGFVEVNKKTMQHVRYQNVFAIGDCSSTPNSKTAAAAAAQLPVVYNNMLAAMNGKILTYSYDGYASCPLVTGYGTCILAEFDYDLNPLETFPIEQGKERHSMYTLKKDIMPHLYWYLMLNGFWNGPEKFRNWMHLNF